MHKITKLQSGLRLITIPLKETKAVTVLVLVKVGSRYEAINLNGASHFIEHLMFKGTKKRPTTQDLSQELDSIGAEYNAYTTKEHTGYYIKADASHLELAIDMLSDMLTNSKFDPKEITRERGTIVEEINMYEDNPIMFASAFLEQVMFGKNNFLGQYIIGPKENIKNITRTALLKFRDQFYNPANIVIGICGNFKPAQATKLVRKYFSISNPSPRAGQPLAEEIINQKYSHLQTKPQIEIKPKKTEQTQLCLGWPTFSYFHKDVEVLEVLNTILGANMSSRLFINVRERQGLCYFIKSDLNFYGDIGAFVIQAGLDNSQLPKAIKLILSQVKKITAQKISPEELKKAKDYIKGKTILALEESADLADWYTVDELLIKETITPEEKLKLISRVSSADLKRVAASIFKPNKTNLAIIGQSPNKNTLLKLLK